MHKILFTVILFCGILFAQEYNWEVLPNSPDAGRHDDIHFLTSELGWAINSNGQVAKTTNGGTTWTVQKTFETYLRAVRFADSLNGWVSTLEGSDILYSTSDGGKSWNTVSNIPDPKPAGICGISIVGNVIYGVGVYYGPAVMIKSTDRGATWTSKDMSNYAANLIDCYFFTPDSGFATGGTPNSIIFGPGENVKAVILFTSDGGNTWSTRFTSDKSPEWGWKIHFPTRTTGYVSIENYTSGSVIKTTNGGSNWGILPVPGLTDLEGIGFINENTGWVAGRVSEGFTTNGGVNWSTPGIMNAVQLNRFQFFGDSIGYAAGRRIYKYTKNKPVSVNEPAATVKSFLQSQNYPNPFNPSTTIEYFLPEASNVLIRIYDGLGKQISTIYNSHQGSGKHSIIWDGTDGNGNVLSSGLYIYRIDAGKFSESKMMMMIK